MLFAKCIILAAAVVVARSAVLPTPNACTPEVGQCNPNVTTQCCLGLVCTPVKFGNFPTFVCNHIYLVAIITESTLIVLSAALISFDSDVLARIKGYDWIYRKWGRVLYIDAVAISCNPYFWSTRLQSLRVCTRLARAEKAKLHCSTCSGWSSESLLALTTSTGTNLRIYPRASNIPAE